MNIVFAASGRNEPSPENEAAPTDPAFLSHLRQIREAAGRLLALVEPPPPVSSLVPAASRPTGPAAAARRLLVVGDSEASLDVVPSCPTRQEYAVAVAANGVEALRMIREQGCDTVLMDVRVPETGGRKRARRRERSPADTYVPRPFVVLAQVQTQHALKRQKEQIRKLAEELELRNRFIQRTFGRYLSDEVVAGLLESPEGLQLGGEQRRVTILMSALRGFTSLSERLGPQQVVQMLNSYLGTMADVIMKHKGTIDEFIGDAILAIFGAPVQRADDARRALACAVDMQVAVAELNRRHHAQGLPRIEMGVAVHSGDVVVGNIGSEKRAKYGVVGSPVNQTGRIESFTVGGQILVSAATVEEAGPDVAVGTRLTIEAKGAAEPIVLYDLRGIGGEYGLFLPAPEDVPVRLTREVRAHYQVLEGKTVSAESFAAGFVELSARGGLMRSARRLRPLSNLKIQLAEGPGSPAGALYAKVLEAPDAEENLARVRFTSVPPDVEAWLERTPRS